ncbi:MAG: hypothetical protein ACYCUZ_03805 [Cuniculiplasma sp.]|jgi:hypothetical protein
MASRKLSTPDISAYSIVEIDEVKKDLKKISVTNFNKYYELFKKVLPQMYMEREYWNTHRIFKVSGLKCACEIYIAKKLRVKGMKGDNHFRIVFNVVEEIITIIEVFQKSNKEIEDKDRICGFCNQEQI